MTVQNLDMVKDANGNSTFSLKFTDGYRVQLAASVAQQITIPAGSTIGVFNASSPFWVDTSNSGLPTGSVTASTSKLAPSQLDVRGVSSIWVIARVLTDVSVSFYGGGTS